MYNYNEPLSTPNLFESQVFTSTVYREEYNCSTQENRGLESYYYAEKNGLGNMVGMFKKSNDEWKAYQPSTMGETLWKIACDKYFKK